MASRGARTAKPARPAKPTATGRPRKKRASAPARTPRKKRAARRAVAPPKRVVLLKVTRNRTGRKKYTAHFEVDGRLRKTQFGARGYSDFTVHRDRERRARYQTRHKKDLKTRDPTRAGYLSFYLLWGESTSLAKNVAAYRRMLRGRKRRD